MDRFSHYLKVSDGSYNNLSDKNRHYYLLTEEMG
nr:MAG TPA: hypothetical protein [Caudoviricetes sp.]